MIGVDSPKQFLRKAHGAAIIGIAWAVVSAFVLPGAPILNAMIAAAAGLCAFACAAAIATEERKEAEYAKLRFFTVKALEKKEGHMYLGNGFIWDTRHSQAMWDLAGEDRDQFKTDPRAQGDLRIFGIGALEAGPFWIPEKHNNQHVAIFGGPGFGKTRLLELFIDQAIGSGAAVIVIDPKGDHALRLTAERCAAREGRRYHRFDLTLPEISATYNPLIRYTDPAQLGARYAAVCPPASDANKFFAERAAATGQVVATAMDALKQYLRALGGEGRHPPPLLTMLYARLRLLVAQSDSEPTSAAMAAESDLVKIPESYTPNAWTPRLTKGDIYGVDRPHELLGWMVRIVHFHGIAGDLMAPVALTRESVAEIWKGHNEDIGSHPLMASSDVAACRLYEAYVPDLPKAQRALRQVLENLAAVFDITQQGQEYWQRVNSSLPTALIKFRGERERIVSAEDPDIDFPTLFANKEVAYMALGSRVDRMLSEGFARAIIEDLTAYLGEREAKGDSPCKVYLVGDEIGSFITPGFVDMLNKGRSSGLRVICSGQARADFEVGLGSAARAEQAFGSINTLITLRTPLRKDADAFAKQSGQRRLLEITRNFNATPGFGDTGSTMIHGFSATEGASYQVKDKDLVPPEAILNLPTGQAWVAGMGYVALIAFPLIDPGPGTSNGSA